MLNFLILGVFIFLLEAVEHLFQPGLDGCVDLACGIQLKSGCG